MTSRNSTVPTAEKNSVVAGGNPVSSGTRKVAPNMATTCWAPMPMVAGQLSRSCGATTSPGRRCLPSPWTVHLPKPLRAFIAPSRLSVAPAPASSRGWFGSTG
ncbi:hypothetical protein [Georgenia sp. SUBG003]|uniref:hypothetical protein n=1 Tax=Georgenia sp. SUBG003 TaxID=1497974 RepID=UPI003AB2728F